MASERIVPLDQETIALFASKGMPSGCDAPQAGNTNAVKVRRVMQLIRDFSKKPFEHLRILDIACGEGVYAIEAALRGAEVSAFDIRTERMSEGVKAAERLGLKNLRFEQRDIRNVTAESHGRMDVVLFLGILYHLDRRDVFPVLRNIFEMTSQFVIVDTHVALQGQVGIEHGGRRYEGRQMFEHATADSEDVRRNRLQSSIDNPSSFWFTKDSLFRLLHDVGFTSVCQCHVPLEPFKPEDRITLIAARGEPVQISSYPWMNGKTEDEIERCLASHAGNATRPESGSAKARLKRFPRSVVNGALRRFGLKISRM